MEPVYVFEELRLPMELLAAALALLLPFGKRRERFWLRVILGYVGFTLFSLLFFPIFGSKEAPRWIFLSAFWYSAVALTAAAYGKLCFSISWHDALFFDIAAFLSQNIIYCFYHCFMARVLFPLLRQLLPLYILGAALVTALVIAPLYLLFRGPLSRCGGRLLDSSRYTLFVLGGAFLAMMVCLLYYQSAFEHRVSAYDTMAWLSGIAMCVLFLLTQYSIVRAVLRQRDTDAMENLLRSSERHYELAREHIAIINRKCHDLKHQLKALEQASDAERGEYIREARESVDFYQHLIYTDNEALNTILAEKGLYCQEKSIDFRCAVDDVDISFIRLPDLYALLGNAVDNAIEYVETLADPALRIVNLRIDRKNAFVGIQVTNPYAGEEIPRGVLPRSRKGDPHDHGFGLRSIRYLAEKYGGSMEFSAEDGLFSLQVTLPR